MRGTWILTSFWFVLQLKSSFGMLMAGTLDFWAAGAGFAGGAG